MRRSGVLSVALVLGTSGCGAGWRQPPQVSPGPWPKRQQVQVWADGQARQWHGVVVTRDSISGVPFVRDPACDSCRVALPLASVDSVRVGSPMQGFWKSVTLFVAVPFVILYVICASEGGCAGGT